MIDLACDFKQKFTDPKLKEKQSDEVSTRQTPKIYDEGAFDKQMNLFMKGFVFDKWFDANELQIDFDESLIPNRQFTNQVLSWKKGTTESLKTVVVRSETKMDKNKVYAKGTISQIGAIGTIEQVVFYMPTGLKKKTYKVTAYPARK